MQIATTFRDMTPSPALQAAVERWSERLDHLAARIVSCHVAVEKPHRHHTHGSGFRVTLTLTVPGASIAASRDHLDPYVAVADAFRAARRQLVHHIEGQRTFVKPPLIDLSIDLAGDLAAYRAPLRYAAAK